MIKANGTLAFGVERDGTAHRGIALREVSK